MDPVLNRTDDYLWNVKQYCGNLFPPRVWPGTAGQPPLTMIESCGVTECGRVRTENQDRILTDAALGLYVVADGMGGHQHGELAAQLAISTVRFYIESSSDRFDVTWPFGYDFNLSIDANRLTTAIQLANRQVWNHSQQSPECVGMGTTIAAALVRDDHAVVANVGDSRVYLFRRGELKQLTYDDTFINSLGMRDDPNLQGLLNHPMRNVLTQAAGSREEVEVHIVEQEIESGDRFLLCSDGLHGVIGDAEIHSIVGADGCLEATARRLNDVVHANGAPDNVSVVLLNCLPEL